MTIPRDPVLGTYLSDNWPSPHCFLCSPTPSGS